MKIYTSNLLNTTTLLFAMLLLTVSVSAQKDSLIKRVPKDTGAVSNMNMDAIYNRPFLTAGKLPVAIGGYMEANTQYGGTDGVSDGFSFQMRRMTLFVSSSITRRIRFLSELELEEGTKEFNLEYCAMDIQLDPLLNLRAGIIMNPIGGFNQNHDGPRWDFVDRPITATDIIPTTLSNVGMGIHGKYFAHNWIMGYELYLTNGFDDKVVDNETGRTSLHEAKENADKFAASNSGLPMYTGKVAVRNRKIGELGLSYMSGVYNTWQSDGLIIDKKRSATVMAVDYNTSLLKNRINIRGEVDKVLVDVPDGLSQQYGKEQWGAYTDIIYTVLKRKMFGWDNAKLNVGVRGEYADFNVGKFNETNTNIGDDVWAVVPTIAFRPSGTTVIRFNYRYQEAHDLLNNAPSKTTMIQLGFSSYF